MYDTATGPEPLAVFDFTAGSWLQLPARAQLGEGTLSSIRNARVDWQFSWLKVALVLCVLRMIRSVSVADDIIDMYT